MKYLLVLSKYLPVVRVYNVAELNTDTVSALIDLIVNGWNPLDDSFACRCLNAEKGIISCGKVLQLNKAHPYALCDSFEVKE